MASSVNNKKKLSNNYINKTNNKPNFVSKIIVCKKNKVIESICNENNDYNAIIKLIEQDLKGKIDETETSNYIKNLLKFINCEITSFKKKHNLAKWTKLHNIKCYLDELNNNKENKNQTTIDSFELEVNPDKEATKEVTINNADSEVIRVDNEAFSEDAIDRINTEENKTINENLDEIVPNSSDSINFNDKKLSNEEICEILNNEDLTDVANNENINEIENISDNNELSKIDTDYVCFNDDTKDGIESLKITADNEEITEEVSDKIKLLETNVDNKNSDELEEQTSELEEPNIVNKTTDNCNDNSSDLIEKTVNKEDTIEAVNEDNLSSELTNDTEKISDFEGSFDSAEINENKSGEAECQTEFENNKSVSGEQIIDLIDLENTLENAGVSKSETKPFAAYLLSAYMHKIPVLLAGPSGEHIAYAYSASVCGSLPKVLDCNKEYDENNVKELLECENEVVLIKHPFSINYQEALLKILSERKKFYILVYPFYDYLFNFAQFNDSVMPFITELIIDKPPIIETLNLTKIELPKHTNKFVSIHNELLKDMKLSPYCINQIQTLLSEMHHILCNDSTINDYKYVLFPYAYVTNQGDSISEKWLKIDKDAERYISKYFNV